MKDDYAALKLRSRCPGILPPCAAVLYHPLQNLYARDGRISVLRRRLAKCSSVDEACCSLHASLVLHIGPVAWSASDFIVAIGMHLGIRLWKCCVSIYMSRHRCLI